jgi:spartin
VTLFKTKMLMKRQRQSSLIRERLSEVYGYHRADLRYCTFRVDMWVVLEIGSNFSFPVRANQTIIPQRNTSSYTFPSSDIPGAAISLVLSTNRQSDSIEQFEELLTDYCAFQSDAKGKGTIELMDEKGQLLGTIDGPWQLEEDAGLHKPGFEKDPVLLELPPDEIGGSSKDQKITVSAAPRTQEGDIPAAYQNDWLFKGANFVSKSLITGSAWAGQKMTSAADSYVAKSTPPTSGRPSFSGDDEKGRLAGDDSRPLTTSGRPAVTFHPKVHAASQQVKAFSGTAVAVSNSTRDAVLNVAGKVGDKIGKTTGIQAKAAPDGTLVNQTGIRGALNRSLIAANVVLDGLTQSADTLLASGGEASGRAIEHRYGSEVSCNVSQESTFHTDMSSRRPRSSVVIQLLLDGLLSSYTRTLMAFVGRRCSRLLQERSKLGQ